MSDWLNNEQWGTSQGLGGAQQGQNNWMLGQPAGVGGEWQAMQQAPPPQSHQQGMGHQGQFTGVGQSQFHHSGGMQSQQLGFSQQHVPFGSGAMMGSHGNYPRQQAPLAQPGQGYSQQQQVPRGPPGQMVPRGYPPHQQQSQQQSQQQVLQRQQQELERKAREEQKQRELEIQRRKMKNINISSPASGNLDTLIVLPNPQRSGSFGSSGLKSSPPVVRPTLTTTVAEVPSMNSVPAATTVGAEFSSQSSKPPMEEVKPAQKQPDPASLDKLMESSLSNLADPSSTRKRTGFNFPQTSVPTSRIASTKQTYSPSTKARAWTADTSSLEGVFAQHSQGVQQQEEEFGDFHSGPALPNVSQFAGQGVQTSGQGIQSSGQVSGHSVAPPSARLANLDASKFPPVYLEVYRQCASSDGGHLSTDLLFPILLSSQLPSRVLRDLWTQANRDVPGKLNQTELFVLLGLIGLVQSGNPNPTMADLKQAPQPPIPQLSALQASSQGSSLPTASKFGDFQQGQGASSKPPPIPASVTKPFAVQSAATKPSPIQPATVSMPSPALPRASEISSNQTSDVTPSPLPAVVSQSSPAPTRAEPSDAAAAVVSQPGLAAVFPITDYKPPPDDKYSAFSGLDPHTSDQLPPTATSSENDGFGDFTSFKAPPITTSAANADDDFGAFSAPAIPVCATPPSTLQPTPAAALSSTGKPESVTQPEDDEFGSFASMPPSQPSVAPSLQTGWADFAQMSFGTGPTPPNTSQPVSTAAVSVATTSASTAFDDILPMEFGAAKSQPKTGVESASGTVESKLTPELQPKLKKHLTGLEILEEEMSNRLVDSAPELPSEPLVAETLPVPSLDDSGGRADAELESNSGSGTSLPGRNKADPSKVWRSCLEKCLEVLTSCAEVFGSVEEQAVLEEIVESEEGTNRLRCIAEVYRLARRIHYSIKDRKCECDCKVTVQGIAQQWSTLGQTLSKKDILEQLYRETQPVGVEEVVAEEDFLSDTISRCSLCLVGKIVSIPAVFSLTGSPESYPLPLLFHEGQMYHPTCANFWINVVQEKLPKLSD